MEIESPSKRAPLPPHSTVGSYMHAVVARLRSGQEALGERLLVLSEGPVAVAAAGAVAGAQIFAMGLDRHGLAVLIVAASGAPDGLPQEVSDRLARMATLSEVELAGMAEASPEGLRRLHAELFGLEEDTERSFNAEQRALVVLDREPSQGWWSVAEAELGARLDRVYLVRDGVADPLSGSLRLTRSQSSPAAWLRSRWGTAVAAALVASIFAAAITAGVFRNRPPQLPVIDGFVTTVVSGVPGDATHTQWTGQHRLVRTSDDRLHVLYTSAGRLHVVTDRGNGGRTWENTIAIPDIRATSLSAAADGQDRLLIAYTDDRELRMTTLTRRESGWVPGHPLVLDSNSVSRVVDIAWDPAGGLAHVVWAAEEGTGEVPQWAAVTVSGDPRLSQTQSLAPASGTGTVLVSVAVTPATEILATYRSTGRGGFFSRTARRGAQSGRFEWGPEEAVPVDTGVGAESLVVDGRGMAHLALRDDINSALLYFRKAPGKPWERREVAVRAPSPDEIDFPTLSVDERSGLVYLFFQNEVVRPSPQIRVLVRDPVEGWLGSYQVINPQAVPEGANFPIASGTVSGSASVLWTMKGPTPEIQIARFIAP